MSICWDYHPRKGIVANQNPHVRIDRDRAFMARAVCDRPGCIAAAKGVVRRTTGEAGVYYPDPTQEGVWRVAN